MTRLINPSVPYFLGCPVDQSSCDVAWATSKSSPPQWYGGGGGSSTDKTKVKTHVVSGFKNVERQFIVS
jgi:hypothetical protein